MYMESMFIAEAIINKREVIESHLLWNFIPILGSSSGYREKQPGNHMIDSQLAKIPLYPKIHLTPLITVEF